MNPERIGAAIKSLRKKGGYTQRQLADCLNVTDKAVSKWERGLSIPDISIVTRLSDMLSCDVDNLLEGNITYLEKTWQGFLRLQDSEEVTAGSDLFGKPLVDILLGYFLLAGIGEINISCSQKGRQFVEKRWGNGENLGITLIYLPENETAPPNEGNTMVVDGSPFIYGPFLTRCFQRAMSRLNGISVMTVKKPVGKDEYPAAFNTDRQIKSPEAENQRFTRVPISFFPRQFFQRINDENLLSESENIYAEPLDNGMIEYLIRDRETLLDTAAFIAFMEKRMNRRIYDLKEIARNRSFIP